MSSILDEIELESLEYPPGMSSWAGTPTWKHPHPTSKVAALEIEQGSGEVNGLGIWNLETGRLIRWEPRMYAFAWFRHGREAAVISEEPHQTVVRMAWPSWQRVAETKIPSVDCGCAVQRLAVSRDERWIATQRWSGQGEWGYDLLSVEPLRRRRGVTDSSGYMLELPSFSERCDRLLLGYGERWLGGWWAHELDDLDEPARGGPITFGWLLDHDLEASAVKRHELRMEMPAGWLPDDPEGEEWIGPQEIALAGNGIRMILPGGLEYSIADPLPEVIWLPAPPTSSHPAGGRTAG